MRHDPPPEAPSPARPVRSPSGHFDEGRFLPGTVLAERYRVFGLVGKGGMGEVYRADDLKLGQVVALKFLPVEVERDAARLSRFLEEVRIARQISHPNVCRVYDVSEVDGHHFLSMEFVDGEDLASLLRRIGRLPRDKAIQIARQLCAGLAAAHEQGILHRDLKPSNVMIDGRGRARITDFGLARLAVEIHGADVRAGTPAFMAPEQLAGKGVTARSDLYSLGLVLYELFTGQPAFKPPTPAEGARRRLETTPTSPSHLVEGFDPAVERVILRCLEQDAANRPASALAVAAALPGGDPLAAALAAGETPSPELVAEAGAAGGLRPAQAWACLSAIVIGVVCVVLLAGKSQLTRIVPLPKPPDVLCDRARDIIRTIGYTDPPNDTDFGFAYESGYIPHVAADRSAPPGWSRLATGPPYAIAFWFRQSPRPLIPYDDIGAVPSSLIDPPLLYSGMVNVRLDPEGRLRQIEAIPPEHDDASGPAPEPDWAFLITQAGFDPAALKPAEPAWAPVAYADRRAAWEGAYPNAPSIPVRIEAASYRGKPVAFRIIEPWTRPLRMGGVPREVGQKVLQLGGLALGITIMVGGALVARRNLRLGRGDRKGSLKLAMYVLATSSLTWLVWAHHLASPPAEFSSFLRYFGNSLFLSGAAWAFYLALEPFLRRLWPQLIVSWVRLLDGRFRDPLVGRDVLLGTLGGIVLHAFNQFMRVGPAWIGLQPLRPDLGGPPSWVELAPLRGLRHSLGGLFALQTVFLVIPLAYLILLLLCRIVLRRPMPAIVVFVLLTMLADEFSTSTLYLGLAVGVVNMLLFLFVLFRCGLLGIAVWGIVSGLLAVYPMTFDAGAWYAGGTLLGLSGVAAIALYGFRTALGGRPAFGDAALPDS
jgi:serine/threonine-protein kinase